MNAVTGRRALVCAPLLPEYDREGGSRRLYDFVDFLLVSGWAVTFICENVGGGQRYMHQLRQRGVATYAGFGAETETVIQTGRFDIAIVAFWHLARSRAGMIRRLSPRTRIIVESVDLHWLRNARRILGRNDGPPARLDRTFADQMVGELNAYAEADGVFTVSQKEADLVNDITARQDLAYAVPDCEAISASPIPIDGRRGILFIGNFRHPPNVDAVAFLCDEIVPHLPESLLSEHPILIVGNSLDDRILRLASGHPAIRAIGWVPSVEPYLHAARVSVIPLRYGAGTKRKLLQAMMAGTPSVSTGIGIEGLNLEAGRHALVADDPVAFAASIRQLIDDTRLWRRMSVAGRERVLERHGRESARQLLIGAIDSVLTRSPAIREDRTAAGPDEGRDAEIRAVRHAARSSLPPGARVLVVSRGDPDLLAIEGRIGHHFPAGRDGVWIGYHPRDGADALKRLQSAEQAGDYLLIPGSAFWWLEHYTEFARHLDENCRRVWDDDTCSIYALSDRSPASRTREAATKSGSRGRKRRKVS